MYYFAIEGAKEESKYVNDEALTKCSQILRGWVNKVAQSYRLKGVLLLC